MKWFSNLQNKVQGKGPSFGDVFFICLWEFLTSVEFFFSGSVDQTKLPGFWLQVTHLLMNVSANSYYNFEIYFLFFNFDFIWRKNFFILDEYISILCIFNWKTCCIELLVQCNSVITNSTGPVFFVCYEQVLLWPG